MQDPSSTWSTHLFIDLDGNVTCFFPNDTQLANTEKFPSKSVYAKTQRNKIKDINDGAYAKLADYLMHGCYVTGLCGARSSWGGKTGCNNFSINIMLERVRYEANSNLNLKGGYTGVDLYTNTQIDTVYNVLQALTNEGINKKNILGLSDVALAANHIAPYAAFWRQLNERHSGFLPVPYKSATHNINSANKLKRALSRIGYTNPIDPKTHEKCIGEDCWLRRINAFILHYLPEEKFRLDDSDGTVFTAESVYPDAGTCYSKELKYNMLRNKYPYIISAILQVANYYDNL